LTPWALADHCYAKREKTIMSAFRTVSALALCAGLLVACSKPAGGGGAASGAAAGSASGASGAASATPGPDVEVNEAQLPHPRAGLWKAVNKDDASDQGTTFCVTDRPFNVGKLKAYCSKFVFHRTWTGGLVIDSVCGKGGVTSTMHGTATGDFQTGYSSDMQMSFTLKPGDPPHVSETHMDYRYVGACSPSEQAEAEQVAKGGE
jgi:hypothetical protein